MSYRCSVCGETHTDLPDIGHQWPDPYFGVPEEERAARVKSDADTCCIDDEDFFIRGVILIPVHDWQQNLGLGVWVSQSRENFATYLENFDTPDIGPFFGWLSNSLPYYDEDTWSLKTMAHFQGSGQRPLIDLEPSEHQLYADYANGISLDRAWSMVHWNTQQGGT